MNLRKFISGVSAFAIAASAFAGLAVTANAADVDLFSFDGSEATVGTRLADSGTNGSTTYGTYMTVKGANSTSAHLYAFSGEYNWDDTNNSGLISELSHGSDSNVYYVLAGNSIASRTVTDTITASEAITTYGSMQISFAMPTYKVGNNDRSSWGASVNLGNLATLSMSKQSANTETSMPFTVAKGSAVTTLNPEDANTSTSFTVNTYSWIDAVIDFDLVRKTAKMTVTYDSKDYVYYLSGITAASVNNMVISAISVNGKYAMGNIAFDDVKLTRLENAPTTTAGTDVNYTVKWVDTEGNELKTPVTRTGSNGFEAAATAADKANFTDANDYTWYYNEDRSTASITLDSTAAANEITLVFSGPRTFKQNVTATYGTGDSVKLKDNVDITEGQRYSYYYPKYVIREDGLYSIGQSYSGNSEYYGDVFTVSGDYSKTLAYSFVTSQYAYFSEIEDLVSDADQQNQANRMSGGDCRINVNTSVPVTVSGVYTIELGYRSLNGSDASITVNGETTTGTVSKGNTGNLTLNNIPIKAGSSIGIAGAGQLDYIVFYKTGEIPASATLTSVTNVQPFKMGSDGEENAVTAAILNITVANQSTAIDVTYNNNTQTSDTKFVGSVRLGVIVPGIVELTESSFDVVAHVD